MRWKGRRKSSNVEDRRGMPTKGIVGGGMGAVVIVVIMLLLGGDPTDLLNTIQVDNTSPTGEYQETAAERELADFTSVVLAETETVWQKIFREENMNYSEPKLVLFTQSVRSACGVAGSSTGPFYCPGDQKVYIDLSFFNLLSQRFKAPGDFAMAYVIAHEVGHHVQNLLGITDQVHNMRGRVSQEEYNEYSVRLELQADFLAGVWAHYTQKFGLLEEGDIEEALNAASAVGDDNIQKQTQGYVVPESFTHGSSEQRKKWFYKGFRTGDIKQGDTFNTKNL